MPKKKLLPEEMLAEQTADNAKLLKRLLDEQARNEESASKLKSLEQAQPKPVEAKQSVFEGYVPKHRWLLENKLADNGVYHTQDEWISYFNNYNWVMASTQMVYEAAKKGFPEYVKEFREMLGSKRLVTSTRLLYKPNSLDTAIAINYNSQVVQPWITYQNLVPEFERASIGQVCRTPAGLKFLHQLFITSDDEWTIKSNLGKLSEKHPDEVLVWTRVLKYREWQPSSVAFATISDYLCLICDDSQYSDNKGCAIGVKPR